jgi:hypothetical protein
MTFILSKKSKPKLVDNNILNQITKQNVLKKQMNDVKCEKSNYQILITTIHDKCIDLLTNYFWIILIIIVIIYILWCRYKWYQESLKKIHFTYFNDKNDILQHDILQYNPKHKVNNIYNKYNPNDNNQINKKDYQFDLNNQINLYDNPNKKTQYTNKKDYQFDNSIINTQYTNKKDNQFDLNNQINEFDNLNINTQYTNKKDIKYNNDNNNDNNNNIKPINFDIIDNTLLENNSNYSFI